MAFMAAASEGTTWNTISPLDFSASQYLLGSPAEVVTNLTPWSAHELHDVRVAYERLGDVDPPTACR